MLSTTTFAGGKGLNFFQIIKGEDRRGGGVTEMPGVRLPRLDAEFRGKRGEQSERPRLINFLA